MSSTIVSSHRSHESHAYENSGAFVSDRVSSGVGLTPRVQPLSWETRGVAFEKARELRDFNVKRRLKGFVADAQGDTWRVIFVENGEEIPYDLPAGPLRKAGVELRYQPFEMDELESTDPTLSGKVYRFRPLAPAGSATLETLPLDPERERKRSLILSKFGKPQA